MSIETYVFVGLCPTGVYIPDLGRDVPHQTLVSFTAHEYLTSKDLHTARNQKLIFQVRTVVPKLPSPTPSQDLKAEVQRLESENATLRNQVTALEEQVRALKERIEVLQAQAEAKVSSLDLGAVTEALTSSILQRLSSQYIPMGTLSAQSSDSGGFTPEDIPVFLPKSIEGEAKIEVSTSESSSSSVSEARERLKKARSTEPLSNCVSDDTRRPIEKSSRPVDCNRS